MSTSESLVCIGVPVYNGEKFLKNALDSLLSQTFTNFNLIISDNSSTDSTQSICQEYAQKDKRIQYYRQTKNMGIVSNHKFILNKAKSKYFVWAAADDLWNNTFLEKNVKILENNKNFIGSISEIKQGYDLKQDWKTIVKNTKPKNFTKGESVQLICGSYSNRIKTLLKLRQESGLYAVYRTEILKKSVDVDELYVWPFQILFKIAKFGETNLIDEVLMYKYLFGETGVSTNLSFMLKQHLPLTYIIFPHLHFTTWCFRKLGIKTVFKNFFLITRYFLQGESQLLIELLKK